MEHDDFLKELKNSGVADDNFQQLLSLEDKENPRFAVEVVEMYVDRSRTIHGEAHNCLSAEDFTGLFQSLHRYKGSSATIGVLSLFGKAMNPSMRKGAHRVAKICEQICQAAKSGDGNLCSSLLAQLKSDVSIFNKHMEKFLNLHEVEGKE